MKKQILASKDYAEFTFPQNEGYSYSFQFLLIDGEDIKGIEYTYKTNEPSSNCCKQWIFKKAERIECETGARGYGAYEYYQEVSSVPDIVSELFGKSNLSYISLDYGDGRTKREEY